MVIIQENSLCNCLPRLIPSLFHLPSSKFPNHSRKSQSHYIMVEHPNPQHLPLRPHRRRGPPRTTVDDRVAQLQQRPWNLVQFHLRFSGEKGEQRNEFLPTSAQLLKHHLAALACVLKNGALFATGAVAEATAESVTALLDHIKILI
ncbi:hypothetical protein C1H46_001138 [Malus baccata]|uniref:Uncharacterized protein n=1 Tax=Malus baccata TaxID=106549 RepID=A0A540NQN4_MALBA|nr:hypothetical protein C1H46_001138 [Malus baccata]